MKILHSKPTAVINKDDLIKSVFMGTDWVSNTKVSFQKFDPRGGLAFVADMLLLGYGYGYGYILISRVPRTSWEQAATGFRAPFFFFFF